MSHGRYLSLHEVRTPKQVARFWKAHPSTGDARRFARLLLAMATPPRNSPKGGKT